MEIEKAHHLPADAMTRVENLDADHAKKEMESNDDVLVVEVREANEIAELGQIAGAIHVPRELIECCADPTFTEYRSEFVPDKRIILCCAGGGRSAPAADALKRMGYPNVADLHGRFAAWVKSGHPVDKG